MIAKLAWRNLWFKSLNTLLSVILLASSVAIITVLILLQKQFEEKFSSNIDGVDLVLGAQGSPMQLILSSVYHIDNPTGNISYDSAKVWMNHPYIEKAIPLAFGDNYRGFKILGTNADYLEKYQATIEQGKMFNKNFEVVIGSEVAKKMQLKLGATFFGSHGSAAEGEVHEEFKYKVVGIANPTGKVIDNLILSNIPSVWQMHGSHEGHNHEEVENPAHREEGHIHHEEEEQQEIVKENPAHGEEGHIHHDDEEEHHEEEEKHVHDATCNHGDHHGEDMTIEEPNMEITAVLLKFRNKMGIMMWPRIIAQNTKMQAASPAIEVNRIFSLFGVGLTALQYLAYAIMIISGISIFIALYNRLKERKYEFALMRINGASRLQLLSLIMIESLLLCIIGFVFGTIFGRLALGFISNSAEDDFKMSFSPFELVWQKETLLLFATILVGIFAALIPALKVYKLNISKTLANA